MQNVLLVVRSLKIGGIEKVAVNLANALAEQGHNVHLLIYKNIRELEPDPRVTVHVRDFDKLNRLTGIGLVYDLLSRAILKPLLPKSGFFWKGLYYAPLFRFFVRKLERAGGFRFDHIIFRGQGAFDVLWPMNDPRARYVVESYPWLINGNQTRFKQAVDRLYMRAMFDGKRVATVSNGVTAVLQAKCEAAGAKPASLRTIFNPCPVAQVRQMAEAPVDLPAEPYIVHVGRLRPVKNQSLLLRAYARSGIDGKLVIVGKGKMEKRLRELARELDIADRVIFLGETVNPYPWMKHARALVLSSKSEGLGMVLVEALACGTPVVATDCPGGVRDVMVDGLREFIADMNEESLAEKIGEIWQKPPTVAEHWVRRFDAGEIARQFLEQP